MTPGTRTYVLIASFARPILSPSDLGRKFHRSKFRRRIFRRMKFRRVRVGSVRRDIVTKMTLGPRRVIVAKDGTSTCFI